VRVAAAQFSSVGDKGENRRRARAAVAAAGERGASLVVLPEAAMCAFGTPGSDLAPVAEPLDGPFVTALVEAAGVNSATVVAGLFEAADGGVYNTVVVVTARGVVARYRKLHLFDALGWRESDQLRAGDPGDAPAVYALADGLTLGVMTCYDLRFPELARVLVDAGATVLTVPAAWVAGPRKVEVWGDLLRVRAIENTAYVVAAAQPGPQYSGHSMVIDPLGAPIVVLDGETDGGEGALAIADIDAQTVTKVRQDLPVLQHRRFAVGIGPSPRWAFDRLSQEVDGPPPGAEVGGPLVAETETG
jgi:deaminated glutathione amidase